LSLAEFDDQFGVLESCLLEASWQQVIWRDIES
jgi:hypothetical protein